MTGFELGAAQYFDLCLCGGECFELGSGGLSVDDAGCNWKVQIITISF